MYDFCDLALDDDSIRGIVVEAIVVGLVGMNCAGFAFEFAFGKGV